MARNIFMLEERLELEDRLTFAWGWMLNMHPTTLGQAFCDLVAERCRLPKSKFLSAVDHPEYSPTDRPDMLLSTSTWRVAFEHKVGSPLDVRQLERYLGIAAGMPGTHVAFMSKTPWAMDSGVLGHPLYLKPTTHDHFLWTDIYPLVVTCRSPAATDFEMYLAYLGMRPEDWGGLGDPFVAARPLVLSALSEASDRLKRQGWPTQKPGPKDWDIEISQPLPNIHLAYLKLKETMGSREPRVVGRAIEMIIWTKPREGVRHLPRVTGRLGCAGAPIYVRPDWKNKRMGKEFKGELYFTAPIKEVFGRTYGSAVDGMVDFATRVLGYVRDGGKVVPE